MSKPFHVRLDGTTQFVQQSLTAIIDNLKTSSEKVIAVLENSKDGTQHIHMLIHIDIKINTLRARIKKYTGAFGNSQFSVSEADAPKKGRTLRKAQNYICKDLYLTDTSKRSVLKFLKTYTEEDTHTFFNRFWEKAQEIQNTPRQKKRLSFIDSLITLYTPLDLLKVHKDDHYSAIRISIVNHVQQQFNEHSKPFDKQIFTKYFYLIYNKFYATYSHQMMINWSEQLSL